MKNKKVIVMGIIFLVMLVLFFIELTNSANIKLNATSNDWQDFYGYVKGAKIGDVITAKDSNGVVCGTYKVDTAGKYGFMHVYADDLSTVADEGAKVGDVITFYYNGVKINENFTFKGQRETTLLNLTLAIALKDSDKDRIADADDLCFNTPAKTSVDKNGCSAKQFCETIKISLKKDNKCESADWKYNELGKKPKDCQITRFFFWQYCTNTKNAN